jgi:hypothetical protein
MRATLISLGLAAALAGGCAKQGTVQPASEPRRPEAKVAEAAPDRPARTDCAAWKPADLPGSWTYDQRVVSQGENLANDAFDLLRESEKTSLPRPRRESLIAEAVDKFILALKSDPYNVHATYNLAAAYARIGRDQCSLNLLERLIALRLLPSQKAAVDAKVDRLLGRGRYKGDMDPDFYQLRGDSRFLGVVKDLEK